MSDTYDEWDDREGQFAEVTIRVALPVDKEATPIQRKKAICRKLRLSDMADDMEHRPGLGTAEVTLKKTETMEERSMRLMGEAEAAAEKKLDDRRERHFDNHGHRP